MCIGTILITVGWAMLNAAGAGTNHLVTTIATRTYAEQAYLNTFIAGAACSFVCYFLKRHIVRNHKKLP
jgi:ammonia channel protein AmtB